MLTKANSRLADIIADQESIFIKRQPKSAARARAASTADFGWRLTKIDSWAAMMSASLLLALVSTVAPLPELD